MQPEEIQKAMILGHEAEFVAKELGTREGSEDGATEVYRFEDGDLRIELRSGWQRGLKVTWAGAAVFDRAGNAVEAGHQPGPWEEKLANIYARAREEFIIQMERRREDTMRSWEQYQRGK